LPTRYGAVSLCFVNCRIKKNEPLDKEVQRMKEALEQSYGREVSEQEAIDTAFDLNQLAHVFFDIIQENVRRESLLKSLPKGFHLDKTGYCCIICGCAASNENSWHDKNGLKCIACQKAIDGKIIPGSIGKNKESWYSRTELDIYFNLKDTYLNKLVQHDFLKDRKIPGKTKEKHLQVFLIKDNKDTLPPKKLLCSRTVMGEEIGEQYYTSAHWYEWADEKHLLKIAKYRIVEVLGKTFSHPMSGGRFYYQKMNPLFTTKEPILRAEDVFKNTNEFNF
jgi:hypothetical protein